MTWESLSPLKTLIGREITIGRERVKMTVSDYCRGCRKLWAENQNEKFYIKVNKYGNMEIAGRKNK